MQIFFSAIRNAIAASLLVWVVAISPLSADDSIAQSHKQNPDPHHPWYLKAIALPDSLIIKPGKVVKIAVLDDGFRLTHEALQNLIWTNPAEIPGNGIDDDGNGYVDDVHGWDVSDYDNDVSPPPSRLQDFYHGTHNAGIIAEIIRAAVARAAKSGHGEQSFKDIPIRIIPIKCLSDNATKTYLKDAYNGFEYAMAAGADIISCSWGGGPLGPREIDLLKRAHDKGILVIASSGNFSTEKPQYPAAYPTVFAVAGVDSADIKVPISNYGEYVDISAPADSIECPGVFSDTDYSAYTGTSPAVPMVAAVAALGLATHRDWQSASLPVLLKNAADPIDSLNSRYAGKLGAGRLNAARFLRGESAFSGKGNFFIRNPQGAISYRKDKIGLWNALFGNPKPDTMIWTIKPAGAMAGIRFAPRTKLHDNSELIFRPVDSASGGRPIPVRFNALPESVYVPGNGATVTFIPENAKHNYNWSIDFEAATIDSSRSYCRDEKHMDFPDGSFSDGSGDKPYAWNSDCKWLITAPRGQIVELRFSDFDTEAKTDWIYVFDGKDTNNRIIGLFSGPNVPPIITSSGNEMLVWFVTNDRNEGKGWTAHYKFISPESLLKGLKLDK